MRWGIANVPSSVDDAVIFPFWFYEKRKFVDEVLKLNSTVDVVWWVKVKRWDAVLGQVKWRKSFRELQSDAETEQTWHEEMETAYASRSNVSIETVDYSLHRVMNWNAFEIWILHVQMRLSWLIGRHHVADNRAESFEMWICDWGICVCVSTVESDASELRDIIIKLSPTHSSFRYRTLAHITVTWI